MRRLLAALAALGLMACDEQGDRMSQGAVQENSGVPIQAVMGETFSIQLPANPTTGYRWQYVPDPEPLFEPAGKPEYHLVDDNPTTVGSGGTEIWTFRPLGTGQQVLRMEYRRPWEQDAGAARVMWYKVTVQ